MIAWLRRLFAFLRRRRGLLVLPVGQIGSLQDDLVRILTDEFPPVETFTCMSCGQAFPLGGRPRGRWRRSCAGCTAAKTAARRARRINRPRQRPHVCSSCAATWTTQSPHAAALCPACRAARRAA